MYPVSEAYKAAMHGKVQRFKVRGTIGDVNFDDANILSGSLSITNQCSGSENIEIGQVYIGELDCTFLGLNIERYSWYRKEIKIYFGQGLTDGTYEYIPLGVFSVSEAEYTASGVVVKAYDNVSKLDKTCSSLSTGATPYNLAKNVCSSCDVTLETTEGEFKAFPNGKVTLGVYTENDIETYRDVLSWIAQTCGCFVTASRTGGILFRSYNSDVVDTIDDKHRFTGCSFSDFSTRYTGMSVVNIEKQTTSYYADTPDDALTYNLGSNPYLQISISHSVESMRRSVLSALAKIDYSPFKASCIGNPAYDLGDVLIFSDGIADGNKRYCITKYTWNYGREYTMEGVGKNPALASASSKSDKNIAGLMSQTVSDELIRYTVLRNGEAVNISDGETKSVILAHYLVSKSCHVRINIEVLLTVTPTEAGTPVVVKAIYKADDTEITDRYPTETWTDGQHILTLQYDFKHDEPSLHSFELLLLVNGGNLSIAEKNAYEVISSTGLASDTWKGTFRNTDGNLHVIIDGNTYKVPDRIEIKNYPNKISYEHGDFIDYLGIHVFAIFGDGLEVDITNACTFTPKAGTTYDDQEDIFVQVKYAAYYAVYETGFSLTYNYITDLTVTAPEKTNYRYGEIIDYTGLKVVARFRDGTQADVTSDCDIVPSEGTLFDYHKLS